MDESAVIQSIKDIIFVVDSEYHVKYASPQISKITGKSFNESENIICYKNFIGRAKPCPKCPVSSGNSAAVMHDIIADDGGRYFYNAFVTHSDDYYVESLSDVTAFQKELNICHHLMKEISASEVAERFHKQEIKDRVVFLTNVINSLGYGLMVADTDYNIVVINNLLRTQAGLPPDFGRRQRCYNIYGKQDPCDDCPFKNRRVTKLPRMMGNSNMTVMFESFGKFLAESVRDSTREIQIINEIRKSQDEINEKQRQMELLNRDLLRMNTKLKEAQNIINEDMKQVGAIQQSLLPSSLPDIPGYEFGALYIPAEFAGGDYYDYIEMSNNYWGFAIADVSGHGTPAAVIMAMARVIMRSYTYDIVSSSEALTMVNDILCENVYTQDFVTMFYMVLDSVNAKFNFASAGHNPVLHFDSSDMLVRQLMASGLFLASFPNVEYEEKTLTLDSGDIIFMYTDGLVEAMNPRRDQYGMDRIISRLIMYSNTHCNDIIEEIVSDARSFSENMPFGDDVTILVIKKL
ncbi:MAG: PP2C family protein-serine/threonine phosphatase [Deferribacteraceae bacterium]|jgi:sigma-B regulation protein RsbU (phosphoserine phosphatase)|nr:PP2C family protein-serine/threonine phosphatase [Deferribacteraceae bacterium]